MRFNVLYSLLSLSFLCLALAQVSYDDCCLKYVKHLSHSIQKHATRYKVQETDGGCNIPAIIFIMRRGRMFCTDPREKWVIELKDKIDKKQTKSMRNNKNKGPRKDHPQRPNRV
ncbi:C-C motif chemokine 25 [Toxotes jaculatrix]|uniref:C-C motif chemokine 25 n=1 Tax=Toxotes jaculatrix TaxID=941984 RepID=UPI001B3A9BBA|nr:C-C motif chemokine 25 [Toxotes jaculatrix]